MNLCSTPSKYLAHILVMVFLAGCALSSVGRKEDTPQEPSDAQDAVGISTPVDDAPTVYDLPAPVIPLNEKAKVRMTQSEISCMTQVLYREARGEGDTGMIAVGYAVLNRMATPGYPHTVCGVVFQKRNDSSGNPRCQFQWACSDLRHAPMRSREEKTARELAVSVMRREVANPVDDSIFFHEKSLHPSHVRGLPRRAVVANHAYFALNSGPSSI